MRLLSVIVICFVVILSGCRGSANTALNTSKLEKVEVKGNVTEEQLKNLPIPYKAPSVKEGLDALPFKMKLPTNLPSELGKFLPPEIDDFEHDGKKIRVRFTAFSKDLEDELILEVTAHNFKVGYGGSAEEVEIQDGITGNLGNSLNFEKDGVYYDISYNKDMEKEDYKKTLIELAKQILQ